MKTKHILFLLLGILLVCALLLSSQAGYISVLEANWELAMPSNAQWQEVYATDSGPSPHGDGWRYHVYSYQKDASVAEMVEWLDTQGETIFQKSYSEAAEEWLDVLEVPESKRPNYDDCIFWYDHQNDNSQIILCLNREKKMLYVLELFI